MIRPKGTRPLLPGTLKNLFFPPEKYEYFALAGTFPFESGNSMVKAAWAADASMLSYARCGSQAMPDADFRNHLARGGLTDVRKIGDWTAPGTQGFFASNDRFAILAFRGTDAEDPSDTAHDADLLPVHEPDFRAAPSDPRPGLLHFSMVEHLFSKPCLVHQGFQRALNDVWDQVHDCLVSYRANHPGAEICLTGHSLGGALAMLTLSRSADPDLSLITFGCPRVGNQAFCDRTMQGRKSLVFRCVNFNDAVAHVPPEGEFYRHAPVAFQHIDNDGNLSESSDGSFKGDVNALEAAFKGVPGNPLSGLDIPAPPALVDHSPARYCVRLWNLVSS